MHDAKEWTVNKHAKNTTTNKWTHRDRVAERMEIEMKAVDQFENRISIALHHGGKHM